MYMSYMLPIVEYASVVWGGCSEQDSVTLQKVQNEAARLVTGLTRTVSLEKVSEYDQEVPQSQTADHPVAPRGRAAQPSRDTRKTN